MTNKRILVHGGTIPSTTGVLLKTFVPFGYFLTINRTIPLVVSDTDRNFFGRASIAILGISEALNTKKGVIFSYNLDSSNKIKFEFSPKKQGRSNKEKKDFKTRIKQEELDSFYKNICELNNIN